MRIVTTLSDYRSDFGQTSLDFPTNHTFLKGFSEVVCEHTTVSKSDSTAIVKFADDTAEVSHISDNKEALEEVTHLENWENILTLSVSKTNELRVDFG